MWVDSFEEKEDEIIVIIFSIDCKDLDLVYRLLKVGFFEPDKSVFLFEAFIKIEHDFSAWIIEGFI